jgi:hypothetical protein
MPGPGVLPSTDECSELFASVAMAHILLKVKAHEDHVSWRSLDGLHVPSL